MTGITALPDISSEDGSPWKWKHQCARTGVEHYTSVAFISNIDWKKTAYMLWARHLIHIISCNPTEILQNKYYFCLTAEKIEAEKLNDLPNKDIHISSLSELRDNRSLHLPRTFWFNTHCVYRPGVSTPFLWGPNTKYFRLCWPVGLCCTHPVQAWEQPQTSCKQMSTALLQDNPGSVCWLLVQGLAHCSPRSYPACHRFLETKLYVFMTESSPSPRLFLDRWKVIPWVKIMPSSDGDTLGSTQFSLFNFLHKHGSESSSVICVGPPSSSGSPDKHPVPAGDLSLPWSRDICFFRQ